ncbi:conserved hypothetical protein [Mesorhizobium prunaredense]|uniref:Lytic murein transglycosylase n=1 Tax=Mesorhizobium prunaredense TaxID=1631249 RepID=A0A1R3VIP0_9HYPH|nr:conserved hypothetical protein [Mesorhizobium prunaredense]
MKLPISPLAGEMPGRAEGGAVPPTCQPIFTNPQAVSGWDGQSRKLAILPTPLCPALPLPKFGISPARGPQGVRKGGDWMSLQLSPTINAGRQRKPEAMP